MLLNHSWLNCCSQANGEINFLFQLHHRISDISELCSRWTCFFLRRYSSQTLQDWNWWYPSFFFVAKRVLSLVIASLMHLIKFQKRAGLVIHLSLGSEPKLTWTQRLPPMFGLPLCMWKHAIFYLVCMLKLACDLLLPVVKFLQVSSLISLSRC